MNERYKFRAWYYPTEDEVLDGNEGEIISHEQLANYDPATLVINESGFHFETHDGEVLSDMVLMQYTGLKDKNGVEIYEGDIVAMIWGDWLDRSEEIKYQDGQFGYGSDAIFSSLHCLQQDGVTISGLYSCFEVIGNIHQDGHLLK